MQQITSETEREYGNRKQGMQQTWRGLGKGVTWRGLGKGVTWRGLGKGVAWMGLGKEVTWRGLGKRVTWRGLGKGYIEDKLGEWRRGFRDGEDLTARGRGLENIGGGGGGGTEKTHQVKPEASQGMSLKSPHNTFHHQYRHAIGQGDDVPNTYTIEYAWSLKQWVGCYTNPYQMCHHME